IAVSPGSRRLTKHASMPAEPVPESGSVKVFSVRNTVRSRAIVSSSTARNSGSMCPSSGRANAAVASGYGFDGPGPSSRRGASGTRRRYVIRLGGGLAADDEREPVHEQPAHLALDAISGDEPARDFGGRARDMRDVGIRERNALRRRGAL